jgi:hypothetical protein
MDGLQQKAVEQAKKQGLTIASDYVLNGIAYNPSTKK